MIEGKTLPQIVDMDNKQISALLRRVNFGHLGLCRNERPYVIPIHFGYARPGIYFYTTEGLKTEILDVNPTVCLQVEDIIDGEHWQSVIVTGEAELLQTEREIDNAIKLIKSFNPKLVPAWSIRWMDNWVRSNHQAVYRISQNSATGRRTLDNEMTGLSVVGLGG